MIQVTKQLPSSGNVYILFGFEAIQARPNLDPYTSTLRTNDETMQVFTSDVHLKHHVRRGLRAYAAEKGLPHAEELVFYEKEDASGNPVNFEKRLKNLRKAFGITKEDKKDALHHCLDLPLFGYVHAVEKQNFSVTNTINTLFRPVTFHGCEIFSLGRNNAFPTLDKNGEVKESAGSATVDSLEYGFFLALWEINLNMLRINAKDHKVINWEKEGAKSWLEAALNGMWKAYTSDRYPSFTQRSQFAQFAVGWMPQGNVSYQNPADLFCGKLKTHKEAMEQLDTILPEFLKGWGCGKDNLFAEQKAANFTAKILG